MTVTGPYCSASVSTPIMECEISVSGPSISRTRAGSESKRRPFDDRKLEGSSVSSLQATDNTHSTQKEPKSHRKKDEYVSSSSDWRVNSRSCHTSQSSDQSKAMSESFCVFPRGAGVSTVAGVSARSLDRSKGCCT